MAEAVDAKQLTIFITGAGQGAGLVATMLASRAGHKVVGTTNLGSKGAYRIRRAGGLPIYPDLTRESAMYSALQMAKADVIINAAPQALNGIPQYAVAYDAVLPWLEASTEALMSAAGRADIDRIIHLSAASIYGDTHHEAVKEDAHLDLSNALGRTLHEAEEIVLDGGVPSYVLRTGYIVGTHQAAIEIAEIVKAGKSVPSGTQQTAWAHESDVASAALLLAEKTSDENSGTIYNIASPDNTTADEVLNKLGELVGIGESSHLTGFMLQFRSSAMQRTLMTTGTLLDTTKAEEELGWSASGSIDNALDKMLITLRSEDAEVTVYHQAEEDNSTTGIVKA